MGAKLQLEGHRFGKWLVLSEATKSNKGKTRYLCRCDCGVEKIVIGSNMVSGMSDRCKTCGQAIHGDYDTAFYQCWSDIKQRCLNVKCTEYKNYGGRGITVCEEWLNGYINFKRDMFSTYRKGLSIERIDNNKGYYKENCRWATDREQCRNMRINRYIDTIHGRMLLVEAAELAGIKPATLRSRLRNKKIPVELLLHPNRFPWNYFKGTV